MWVDLHICLHVCLPQMKGIPFFVRVFCTPRRRRLANGTPKNTETPMSCEISLFSMQLLAYGTHSVGRRVVLAVITYSCCLKVTADTYLSSGCGWLRLRMGVIQVTVLPEFNSFTCCTKMRSLHV